MIESDRNKADCGHRVQHKRTRYSVATKGPCRGLSISVFLFSKEELVVEYTRNDNITCCLTLVFPRTCIFWFGKLILPCELSNFNVNVFRFLPTSETIYSFARKANAALIIWKIWGVPPYFSMSSKFDVSCNLVYTVEALILINYLAIGGLTHDFQMAFLS